MEIFWFIAGIMSYMLVSKLLNYGHSILMVKGAVHSSLQLLVLAKEDVSFMRELKRKSMQESNLDQQAIDKFIEVDKQTMENWKLASLAKIITAVPRQYVGAIPFRNWDGAMASLEEEMRNKR
tara:strand:- start:56 stop:424 length:369 start_codon:yes stop_codon:yes gene_type:complete